MTGPLGDQFSYGTPDEIGRIAAEAVDVIRRAPGTTALHRFAILAQKNPILTAQVLMALALWVDPDEPADERTARLRAIAKNKEQK